MVDDMQAPATKQDFQMVLSELGKLYRVMEGWKTGISGEMQVWKSEISGEMQTFKSEMRAEVDSFRTEVRGWKEEIRTEMKDWKDEIIHEFHLVAENMRHDMLGMHNDKIQSHENRITRVEDSLGLEAM